MIPIKLELQNFLSYRNPVAIDFQGIQLACISGANGAGKSSILDGMTWALFGRSRSKSDDDVVNRMAGVQGEPAEVKFSFQLEGITYRIIRRKKPGKRMLLEFQVGTGEGKWKALTENTIRETQGSIEALLKMNFDTFINASFLLQGKADEFTTKTPNKRKEILADLLGVSEWDGYKNLFTARRKEVSDQHLLIDGRLEDIELELAEEPERKAQLASVEEELQSVKEMLAVQEKLLEQVRRTEEAIKAQRQTVRNLADNLARGNRRLESMKETRDKRQQERVSHQILLDQTESIITAYASWEEATKEVQAWQEKADAFNALQQQKRPHEVLLESERSRLTERQSELLKQAKRIDGMGREKDTLAHSLQEGKIKLADLVAKLTALAGNEKAWGEAKIRLQKIEGERSLLVQEAEQLQRQASKIAELQNERPLVKQNLAQAEEALKLVIAKLETTRGQSQRLMLAMGEMDAKNAEQPHLWEEMADLKERISRLRDETGSQCPLCGQPLSEAHRHSVLVELEENGTKKADRYRENKRQIDKLAAEIATLNEDVKGLKVLERDQQAQQNRVASATARLDEIDRTLVDWQGEDEARLDRIRQELADDKVLKAQQEETLRLEALVKDKVRLETGQQEVQNQITRTEARLEEIDRSVAEWEGIGLEKGAGPKEELASVSKQLASNEIAPEAQAALTELEKAETSLGYDLEVHQATIAHRNELAESQVRYQKLQEAQAAVKPLDDVLMDSNRQIADQEKIVVEMSEQLKEAEANLHALSMDALEMAEVEKEVFRLRETENLTHRRVGTAQQRVAVLDNLRRQRTQFVAEKAEASHLIQRLRLLEKACGQEGVQALLIERALPEIEDDANELLQRLTGGQLEVGFSTQRQLKTSDRLAETLDIRITDNDGDRPYENFSGGEQFRVNFAIRLALSKILSKRAGARLQTLVIDEGFGSQDPDGRQRLIEAINTIQDDFERILVITHIDELRDAFPTRIEVEKGPHGSEVTIV